MNVCKLVLLAFCAISIKLSTASQSMTALENELVKLKAVFTPPDGLKIPKIEHSSCTCAVFLTGQFKKGSPEPPTGNPALLHEHDTLFPCTPIGNKQCINKCLDTLVKHLPNSPNILCASIDRDCHKERAYLFTQNCNGTWANSNLSAGREYCCKDGISYKCNMV